MFYLLFTNSFYRNQKHKHGQIVEICFTLNSGFGISEFETLERHQQQTLTAQNIYNIFLMTHTSEHNKRT